MRKASSQKHEINIEFDSLLRASDRNKLSRHLSDFYTRSAYAGTSQETGDLRNDKRQNGSDEPGGNGDP